MFALDLAGVGYVFGQRCETGLISQSQPNIDEPAQQQPLCLADLGEDRCQCCQVAARVRPVMSFLDTSVIAVFHAATERHNAAGNANNAEIAATNPLLFL